MRATRTELRLLSLKLMSRASICAALFVGHASAQIGPAQPVKIDDDGTVHVPAHVVPMSSMLSPEGKAYLIEHLRNIQRPEALSQDTGVPPLLAGYLARQREQFANVERREVTIGGVHAYDYRPKDGVKQANRNRVLINLHGGGFMGCWPGCAELESLPVAGHGRIRVVSLDYRQGPKHKFPAASEDVASAYRELLKTYRAQDIGIYGCSAGGMLAGMSVAWFQRHDLPRPGAIGVLCAGMTVEPDGFGGDAVYTTVAVGEGRAPPPPLKPGEVRVPLAYFGSASLTDPLVSPAISPEVLAKFPPTLVVTGTRAWELSNAVKTHRLLINQGVEADLHVWEGMFHGFFYNIDVPESRECYDVVVKFFERHLGRS
jgi:monoterpene epsilon-lactone hydrolase